MQLILQIQQQQYSINGFVTNNITIITLNHNSNKNIFETKLTINISEEKANHCQTSTRSVLSSYCIQMTFTPY